MQTQLVIDQLQAACPGLDVRVEIISTAGDREPGKPLPDIGTKGLFTRDLEDALLGGSIDLAVHSAKDLQSVLPSGVEILAFPAREDPRDAWVAARGVPFEDIPPSSVVGTSSLRRQAQLLMRRPDLQFIPLRGNVDTRVRKVQRGDCAGAVLAMAGLKRAGLAEHVTHPFDPAVCLPAPAQGALALEGRAEDQRVRELVARIADEPTRVEVTCERAILAELDAGCRAPVAILARVGDCPHFGNASGASISKTGTVPLLHCDALVCDPRGQQVMRSSAEASAADVPDVAQRIIADLRARGADAIIAACRP